MEQTFPGLDLATKLQATLAKWEELIGPSSVVVLICKYMYKYNA